MNRNDLPVGFGMALMQNERAMAKFHSMSESERKAILEKTHGINSKAEMRRLVESLVDNTHL